MQGSALGQAEPARKSTWLHSRQADSCCCCSCHCFRVGSWLLCCMVGTHNVQVMGGRGVRPSCTSHAVIL